MKRILCILSIFLLWGILMIHAYAQQDTLYCGTPPDPGRSMDLTQLGGKYITANGTLRILLVFVSFPNDNNEHPYWPVGGPPTYMGNFIDPNVNTNSTNHANLTNYFDQMSFGLYQVIGEAIWVTAPQPSTNYLPTEYGKANKDVLREVLDPLIDFSLYDNWRRNADYTHINEPDGLVDMIVMIWRGFHFVYLGEASLGYVTGFQADGVTIEMGYPTNPFYPLGSGVTCMYPYNHWPSKVTQTMIHEVGHWLLGADHPYGDKYNVWSILGSQFAAGFCANAFERERLGWINVVEIDESINAPLSDYITTGVAYKYHPPNGATNEWYYIENHQKLSIYDDATDNGNDKGVWVIHQQDIYNNSSNIRNKPTDGLWNWENPYYTTTCFSTNLPAFRKLNVNPLTAGYSHRDHLPKSPVGREWLFAYIDAGNTLNCGAYYRGLPLFDGSFNLNTSTVISPWSNPGTKTWNDNLTNFAMEILSQSGSVVNVHFYVGDAINAKPARIVDLAVTASVNNHPYLTWSANSETDMSQYRIYKSYTNSNFALLATVSHPQNYYEDLTETIVSGPPVANESRVYYRVKAVDTQPKESDFSNTVNIRVVGGDIEKAGGESEMPFNEVADRYLLLANYPNPFNPITHIRFRLPEDSRVRIRIYNIAGEYMATLTDQAYSAGDYEISFDAKDLPSGIYLYRMEAGGYSQVRKMMVIK